MLAKDLAPGTVVDGVRVARKTFVMVPGFGRLVRVTFADGTIREWPAGATVSGAPARREIPAATRPEGGWYTSSNRRGSASSRTWRGEQDGKRAERLIMVAGAWAPR